MKDDHKNLQRKTLKILGVLTILITIFYTSVVIIFKYGAKCACYGIETSSRCFGIKTMCFGLIPNTTNTDNSSEEHLENSPLYKKMESKDFLYVIVGLNVEFIPEGSLSKKGIALQRELIKEKQKELIKNLPIGSSVYKQYQVTPTIAIKVDTKGLDYLIRSPLVKTIHEDVLDIAF